MIRLLIRRLVFRAVTTPIATPETDDSYLEELIEAQARASRLERRADLIVQRRWTPARPSLT